jgi:hypothetical protein
MTIRPRIIRRLVRRLIIVVIVIGAIVVFTPLRGAWRSTVQFSPYRLDPRVCFEPGAEKLAVIVAAALPDAIASVERQQYRAFAKPVAIYICASPESLASYGGPKSAGGFVLNGRLFIASKPQNTAERMPRLLAHELSHLHLEQQLGMLKYASNIPSWFKEGLAVLVSSGGGAETVSVAEAREAIAAGKGFTPEMSGRLLFERSGRSYGLAEHMWYRQSELLVQFLRERDESAFRRLMIRLDGGTRFRSALKVSYPEGIEVLLREFRARAAESVQKDKETNQLPDSALLSKSPDALGPTFDKAHVEGPTPEPDDSGRGLPTNPAARDRR